MKCQVEVICQNCIISSSANKCGQHTTKNITHSIFLRNKHKHSQRCHRPPPHSQACPCNVSRSAKSVAMYQQYLNQAQQSIAGLSSDELKFLLHNDEKLEERVTEAVSDLSFLCVVHVGFRPGFRLTLHIICIIMQRCSTPTQGYSYHAQFHWMRYVYYLCYNYYRIT